MNTIIFKILCWINGIKNPFVWEAERKRIMTNQEVINHLITVKNHLITVKNTCIASGYDSAVEDACDVAIEVLTAIDDIKQEIFNAIDNVPMTLSRNDADNLLKMDIQDIIDKHLKKGEKRSDGNS